MEIRTLGRTGLEISRLGVGLSEISGFTANEAEPVSRVLNGALDRGLNFLDTSACYGNSEELIGQTVAHRRQEFVLATKCGHLVDGEQGQEWTPETIRRSIERSLRRMKTDYLDLVQLHSCGVDILAQGEVIEALLAARDAGKTRFVGYSGDNEAALWAVESGIFDTLQTSFNLVDQQARLRLFPKIEANGMGLIVKRPIANGAWGAAQSPSAYAADYFQRAETMRRRGPIPGAPDNRIVLALGFALAHEAVDTAIVGTQNPAHMQANIDWVENELPLAAETVTALHERFEAVGQDWVQLR